MVIIIRQYNVTFRKVSTHIIVMCHTNLKVKCSYIFFFLLYQKKYIIKGKFLLLQLKFNSKNIFSLALKE